VPRSHQKLDALAQMLERTGEDPLRLELVHRAQRFKRSWVELAEALHELRGNRGYEAWGYADLHEYCAKELSTSCCCRSRR
jgi:GTP cyclohydrolase I